MTAKNVLGECLVKMGLADFTQKSSYSDSEKELLDGLLGALNIAYRETVCEYLPLIAEEKATFLDGQLLVSSLAKQIIYPIKITRGDSEVKFKTYPNRICADISGEALIRYAYAPSTPFSLNSSIGDARITQSALADGTLAQYYFANKVFDLAKSFDASFRNKMGFLRYRGKSLRLKARGWDR